jgi:hypothetical protein
MKRTIRSIRCFPRHGEEVIREDVIINIALSDLQKAFGVDRDDPMYDVFEVNKLNDNLFRTQMGLVFDHSNYDYFLYCNLVND